jgi:[NiFe] hydrogenase diaphorase moiety small subunit
MGRGPDKHLSAGDGGLARTDIKIGDSAVGACPVGAFLEKRVGYAVPVGKRKYDSSPIGSDIEREGGHHE